MRFFKLPSSGRQHVICTILTDDFGNELALASSPQRAQAKDHPFDCLFVDRNVFLEVAYMDCREDD
jgi:hypothetical protein